MPCFSWYEIKVKGVQHRQEFVVGQDVKWYRKPAFDRAVSRRQRPTI